MLGAMQQALPDDGFLGPEPHAGATAVQELDPAVLQSLLDSPKAVLLQWRRLATLKALDAALAEAGSPSQLWLGHPEYPAGAFDMFWEELHFSC